MLLETAAWDPLADLARMSERMHRILDSATPASDFPAINLWADQDRVLVTADLPGIAPNEIELSLDHGTLTLRGARTPDPIREGEELLRQERLFGRFERHIAMPFAVDATKIAAELKNGVLRVTLPRADADKPRKIAVKA
jgi:HSP20 family protein